MQEIDAKMMEKTDLGQLLALPAGFTGTYVGLTGSTQTDMMQAVKAGKAGANHVLMAGAQDAGHGSQGRTWHSPTGNIYMTFSTKWPDALHIRWLNIMAAYAVARAVAPLISAQQTRVKYANDVLVNDRKLSGLLAETVTDNLAIVGVGVNVAVAPELPQGTPYESTSLQRAGADTDSDSHFTVASAILAAFDETRRIYSSKQAPFCDMLKRLGWADKWGFSHIRHDGHLMTGRILDFAYGEGRDPANTSMILQDKHGETLRLPARKVAVLPQGKLEL